jgi:phospho-N-acetylmuramoyl-pentapeptide-transferase
MGGIIILIAILLSSLFWGRLNNTCLILACISTAWLGLLGLSDDYLKIVKRKPDGLIARYKLAGQILLALFVGFYTYFFPVAKENATILNIPFFATPPIDLGPLYVPFVVLVIVGASNAVNLTDGLDGLAIGAVIAAGASFAVITYTTGHFDFAKYLKITHIAQCGELTIFLGALVGAGIGFLWFNAYPAQVFMGDIGSLALGGALGTVAVLSKHELLLAVIGGLFVIEAGSVILQVIGYKLTQKRIFRMAPLHHHFEKLGWSEPKITVRFWIIATIFALLSLSTLKLR